MPDSEKAKKPVPFARLAKIPRDAPDKDTLQKRLAAIRIPSRREVGVPPYPGAVISFAIEGTTMNVHGGSVVLLPVVQLLTTDPTQKVIAFYAEKLPKWKKRQSAIDVTFMPKAQPKTARANTASPSVRVQRCGSEPLLRGAKCRIEIAYTEAK